MRHTTLIGLLCLASLGCATTLRHPQTQATITCKSGWWVGLGSIGGVIATVGNIVGMTTYRACVQEAKAAGYEGRGAERDGPLDQLSREGRF
jgi:hypothetical protein